MKKIVLSDRAALDDWELYRQQIITSTTINRDETSEEKRKRIDHLLKDGNHEEAFKYYFEDDYKSDPAPFHIEGSNRVMANPEWYEVRAWSRELAKSTRSMMEDLLQMLKKRKVYKLLASSSFDNACRLLMPYKIHLESNQRIINDFGKQVKYGSWKEGEITSRMGFSIRAFGADQPPRGTKKGSVRPDIIEFDDFDTDASCANEDQVDKYWKLVTEAFIPTRSISKPTLIRWNGNLIAEDCCVMRAIKFADHVDVINIRDENGKSTWPAKNTEAFIDRVLSQLPESARQKEYFNNPHTVGKSFTKMVYGKVPPLEKFPFLVAYADPSTSNKDLSALKNKRNNSCKSVVLVGKLDLKYYVIKCFVDVVNNDTFTDWLFFMPEYVRNKTILYNFIENNTLQDPFYQQALKPTILKKGNKRGKPLALSTDERKKGEKFLRIEATCQPLNNQSLLILNEEEKNDPHMERLDFQFLSVSPRSKTMDGPDAVQGAITIIDEKSVVIATGAIKIYKRKKNNKRF